MKLSDLKPSEYNPRHISDEQLNRLKKSLHEFGDLSGIVFNRRTGNIVGGHQRLKYLPPEARVEKKELKESSRTGTVAVGVIFVEGESYTYREVDWDLSREKAANIAANQQGGEFDEELLGSIIRELSHDAEFDKDLLGFENDDLLKYLQLSESGPDEEPFDVDEALNNIPEPLTKTGDLYILGVHRLLCGDSTIPEDVSKLMGGGVR